MIGQHRAPGLILLLGGLIGRPGCRFGIHVLAVGNAEFWWVTDQGYFPVALCLQDGRIAVGAARRRGARWNPGTPGHRFIERRRQDLDQTTRGKRFARGLLQPGFRTGKGRDTGRGLLVHGETTIKGVTTLA